MNSQHDANLPSEPHWTEGLETDDSDADDSLGSDACMIIQSPTTNPYKNATPILRKATPYTEAEEWLYDLNAEMHAVISLVHCRKRLRNNGPIDSSYQAISLSEEQIHHLARGGILRMNDTEITPANLTTRYELPRQNWECLAATYRQWRLERTQLSPPDHPANFYVSAVAGLDPFLEHSTALLLLHTLEIYIHSALERVGVPAGKPLRIRHFHRALDTIENVFIRSRIPQNFGNKSPLVQRGIILPEPLQQVEKRRIARQLYLDRQFVSNCTGTEFNDIEPDHGVEIIQPTEQLTDIVLTAQQDEVVQGFLALLPWKTQREDSLAILLHGPPGAGKTLLARCIAGAAQRPLIYVEGSIAAENDYEEEVVTVLLQRAAQEQAILFIDEADEIVPNISCANPSLIMHLNNYPAAVILSTNDPHQLDSALYQRLQIKLPLPMPGPNERMRILIRELRIQGYGFSNGLLESPEIARLAQSNRLSGGDWHKVVQSAQIHAALRAMPFT